jgi:DNA repair exonuclease SbcCD nuclease subunit
MKKVLIKAIAFCMTLVMLTGAVPANANFTKDIFDPPLKIGVISDPHYFPESFVNLNSAEYLKDAHCDAKLMGESSALFRAALETIALRKEKGTFGMEYLLIPGDMTFDGEKPGHMEVAALLRDFEARTGIEVFVVNGNHDINNNSAATYATPDNRKVDARKNPGLLYTTPSSSSQSMPILGITRRTAFIQRTRLKPACCLMR